MTPEAMAKDIMRGNLSHAGLEHAITNALYKAVSTEQERCAKIADGYRESMRIDAATCIAEDIRKGAK